MFVLSIQDSRVLLNCFKSQNKVQTAVGCGYSLYIAHKLSVSKLIDSLWYDYSVELSPKETRIYNELASELVNPDRFIDRSETFTPVELAEAEDYIITNVPASHMLYGAKVTKWHEPGA